MEQLRVREHRRVPLERRRVVGVPDGDELRGVEREHDPRDDRHVQERQAENQRTEEGNGAPGFHLGARSSRPCVYWKIMIGTTSSSSIAMATALATGQSRFAKNSSH